MMQTTKQSRRRASLLVAVTAIVLLGARVGWAQTSETAQSGAITPAATLEQDSSAINYKNLFEIVKSGGPVMVPLFASSFLMMVFVFERAISLRRGRVVPRPFVKRFLHQVGEGKLDRDGAIELCHENGSPIAGVFAAAARKWGRPSVELEQTIIDASDRVAGSLRRYLRIFNAVSTISPLMGLLGTVLGMIQVFNEISVADAMGRTEMLAGGISEAMITTAAGLLIAIPALCFYVLFTSKVDRLLIEIDDRAQELVGMISAEALHEDRQGKRNKPRTPAAA
jgi:biopolymer transport protein ExbB